MIMRTAAVNMMAEIKEREAAMMRNLETDCQKENVQMTKKAVVALRLIKPGMM